MNTQDTAQLPRAERRQAWAAFAARHPDGTLTPPLAWCGYLLRPLRLTFWQGDPDGPSTRTEYRRVGTDWRGSRLAG